jgi:hypothetical protein
MEKSAIVLQRSYHYVKKELFPIGTGLFFRPRLETLNPVKILKIPGKLPHMASWDKTTCFVALSIRHADLPDTPDGPSVSDHEHLSVYRQLP